MSVQGAALFVPATITDKLATSIAWQSFAALAVLFLVILAKTFSDTFRLLEQLTLLKKSERLCAVRKLA